MSPETLAHLIEAGVIALLTVVGYQIKAAIAGHKIEITEKMSEMQRDIDAKHSENREDINVHIAEDNQKFESISRTLGRIDMKLDRMEGRKGQND